MAASWLSNVPHVADTSRIGSADVEDEQTSYSLSSKSQLVPIGDEAIHHSRRQENPPAAEDDAEEKGTEGLSESQNFIRMPPRSRFEAAVPVTYARLQSSHDVSDLDKVAVEGPMILARYHDTCPYTVKSEYT